MLAVSSPIVASFTVSPAIGSVCTKTDTRYAMSKVLVSPLGLDNVRLSATDGKCLAIRHERGSTDGVYLVPGSDLKQARKVELNGEARITFGRNQTRIGTYEKNGENCNFPPLEDFVPKEAGKKFIALDVELLAKVAKAVNDNNGQVLIMFDEFYRPIQVLGPNGIGVIMPVNIDGLGNKDTDEQKQAKIEAKWHTALVSHGIISPTPAEVLDKAAEEPERFEQVA